MYAHKDSPNGKYTIGTRIQIEGRALKAANGTFEITCLFPNQNKGGDQYVQYRRVGKSGKVLKAETTNNHRGSWCQNLDQIASVVAS